MIDFMLLIIGLLVASILALGANLLRLKADLKITNRSITILHDTMNQKFMNLRSKK